MNPNIPGHSGTTSACAENTFIDGFTEADAGNYLRVRGEYDLGFLFETGAEELPPRARRILFRQP